jgi:hypothetical protein
MKTQKTMGKSEYARHRGIAPQTLSRYFKQGKLTSDALTDDGRVIVEKADAMLAERILPVQQSSSRARFTKKAAGIVSKAGLVAGLSMSDAQTVFVQYKAAIKKLEYEERVGKLVDAKKVQEIAFDTARRARDSLLNIPDRLSAILAAESDETKVRSILNQEIRQALEELVKHKSQ